MNSRGRRTQRRADERREAKVKRMKLLPLQLTYRVKKRKMRKDT